MAAWVDSIVRYYFDIINLKLAYEPNRNAEYRMEKTDWFDLKRVEVDHVEYPQANTKANLNDHHDNQYCSNDGMKILRRGLDD